MLSWVGVKQLTLTAVGFERYAKMAWRAAFLAEMEQLCRGRRSAR